MTTPQISDGCTGFWAFEQVAPIRPCCVRHDHGGSDEELEQCIAEVIHEHGLTLPWNKDEPAVVPDGLAISIISICIAIMAMLRPVYHAFKRTKLHRWLIKHRLWPGIRPKQKD